MEKDRARSHKIRFKTNLETPCGNTVNLFSPLHNFFYFWKAMKLLFRLENKILNHFQFHENYKKKLNEIFQTALIHKHCGPLKKSSLIWDGIDFQEHWIYKYHESIWNCSKSNRIKCDASFFFWKGIPKRTASFACNIFNILWCAKSILSTKSMSCHEIIIKFFIFYQNTIFLKIWTVILWIRDRFKINVQFLLNELAFFELGWGCVRFYISSCTE